ncbi:deazaflavin-dependent oxidoreductase (nitroreductase family) [Cryobacterium mesophilum]|uniref:Nitroreductase family deazaflavin-dependent oxidoreductase n=1 Tax=Terrimesophilobacter mesophilus TaxID=433647 RepID=A0A4V3I9F4_9MICO|nr:nitroreductase family deazaflavin-dependent oxidoreductase [Terrimesophilobacter mesophilus]MBB5632403.1 deazaflavin-dependent oxidoreductase (nitroreductase family) [Terrimesophilobacter mesophilus]TFB79238.1 nitroreductase family deazaflavin-dependent oxidoreductase [Terrimesophilobacter mesophilus]
MTAEPGSSPDNPLDNTTDWVAKQLKEYDESDGTSWPTLRGRPLMLLTTKGAKSGVWRRTVLLYGEVDGKVILVASKGGHPQHPAWYVNLRENPEVRVQVHERRFTAIARTATAEEKPRLWALMAEIWPYYLEYQEKTDRDIPVVILDPRD